MREVVDTYMHANMRGWDGDEGETHAFDVTVDDAFYVHIGEAVCYISYLQELSNWIYI